MNAVPLACRIAASCAILVTAACAPAVQGGPRLALPPAIQENALVRNITISSGWLRSEEDFAETFTDEVREELKRCARGTAIIDARVHIDTLHRADRLTTLLNGGGEHGLSGIVEFVDPKQNNRIVGRFPVSASALDPGGLAGLVADRQMVVSEAFGRALCEEAFGRNPRVPGAHNATGN